ncbi:MAG: cytochrome P450 [Actinobacteria bacterium]|nr:cytochrome P450 [Actinomycetota bacterium]
MSVFHREGKKTITGHQALREALRDTSQYSSDLQGDADVRDYRQIPLEIDPPRHHLYRSALAPFFVKPAIEKKSPQFKSNAQRLINGYFNGGPQEVIPNLTLPLVMENLGVIFNRPQDVDEWISWGADVWTAESEVRDGAVLHRYLDRVYSEALTNNSEDIWSDIASMEIEGKQVTPIEFRGIAGVLLAGGRDTVIKLMTGILWHLAKSPEDFEKLRSSSTNLNPAIQEFLRFFSPLPMMNRTTVPESGADELPPDRYVSMSFISANFDESVFENPFEINLERARNPHLSFGFGPHTCLGNHIAEIETRVFLETLIESGFFWKIVNEKVKYHQSPYDRVPDSFLSLTLERTKST